MANVAVIGAGPAGLSAAWTLAQAGAQVTLYERAAMVGGKLRTELIDGAHVDVGVQLVSSSYTSLFDLPGVRAQLQRSPGKDALWRKGSAQEITYGSVTSMLASGALPTSLKFKLGARYLPYLTTHARGLDANDPARTGGAAADVESIASWGMRELGDDFVELLVYPLLAAYYGATPEETTAPAYHALARMGIDITVHAVTPGFGALAQNIAAAIEARGGEIVTNARVDTARFDIDGVHVDVAGSSHTYDAVVLAVPAPRAAALLTDHSKVTEWLRAVQVRATCTVVYRMDRAFPGDYFGLSFPRTSEPGKRVAALCIQSRKLPDLVPSGDALVALPAPAALPALLADDDARTADNVLRALEQAVSGITRRVVSAHVYRFAEGYTVFGVGHLRRITAFDEAWLPDNVALAGDYLVAPTVEGAVRSGAHAARRVLGHVSAGAG